MVRLELGWGHVTFTFLAFGQILLGQEMLMEVICCEFELLVADGVTWPYFPVYSNFLDEILKFYIVIFGLIFGHVPMSPLDSKL